MKNHQAQGLGNDNKRPMRPAKYTSCCAAKTIYQTALANACQLCKPAPAATGITGSQFAGIFPE
jgi:hypothetical protein